MATFQKIIVLDDEIHAQLVGAVLLDQHIPHTMRSYHDSAYDGLFQGSKGWGQVDAPGEFRDQIIGIVNDLSRQREAESNEGRNDEQIR